MNAQEELADSEAALLPPGEYSFWTPCDCYEAAAVLIQAFEEHTTIIPGTRSAGLRKHKVTP